MLGLGGLCWKIDKIGGRYIPTLTTPKFLSLTERAGDVAIWDLETLGFGADYQRIVLCTIKPYRGKPITLIAKRFKDEKNLVIESKRLLEKYQVLVAHNGKRFDKPFLETRLLYWGLPPLEPRHHVDTYLQLKFKLRTSSKSQAALLSFLKLPQQKMGLAPDVWQRSVEDSGAMKELIARNISDCDGLEAIYDRVKHLFKTIDCI